MEPRETVRTWNLGPDGWGWTEVPAPGWGELVVRNRASLLLPEDIAALRAGEMPRLRAQVADVLEAGEEAPFHAGMRIFPAWRASCGLCEACRRGNETLCPDWSRDRLVPAGPSQHQLLPAWNARRGSALLSLSDDPVGQVFLHPLARAIRALRRSNPALPLRLLVLGEGPVARIWGMLLELRFPTARRVLLGQGREDCFRHGFHGAVAHWEEAEASLEGRADLIVAIDPSGPILEESMERLCPGGILVVVGEMPGRCELAGRIFSSEEKRLVSCHDAGPRDFRAAVGMMSLLQGRFEELAQERIAIRSGDTSTDPSQWQAHQILVWEENI